MADEKFAGGGVDTADLYDADVVRIGKTWKGIMTRFSRKEPSRHNLEELAKSAQQAFFDIGFVVQVDVTKRLLGVGNVELEIQGRVPGHADNVYGLDHARKRAEVRLANDRGERHLGASDGRTL